MTMEDKIQEELEFSKKIDDKIIKLSNKVSTKKQQLKNTNNHYEFLREMNSFKQSQYKLIFFNKKKET